MKMKMESNQFLRNKFFKELYETSKKNNKILKVIKLKNLADIYFYINMANHDKNLIFYFDGNSATNLGICYNVNTDSKFAISYDGTSFHRYANGVKLGTYTISASMVNWDSIQTGAMDDAQGDERTWNLKNLKL